VRRAVLAPIVLLALLTGACATTSDDRSAMTLSADRGPTPTAATAARSGLPSYDHVVVVVFENHSYAQIKQGAPYFMRLANHGAEMTRSHAVTHPSEPNYLALYGGSTFGLGSDACPLTYHGGHLARQLKRAGYSFRAYSEGLPSAGYTGCTSGRYARKHAPWVNFSSFRQNWHKPYSSFPSDYSHLPDLSFVIPDLCSDMHDCSIAHGNRWLKSHFKDYVAWARQHNSLMLVTFDEDDDGPSNHIFTALAGAHIKRGNYSQRINHYNVLRTIEALFGLPALRNAAGKPRIRGIWN
jgi:acid phosphatase